MDRSWIIRLGGRSVVGRDRQVGCQRVAVRSKIFKKKYKLVEGGLTPFKIGKIEVKTSFLVSSGMYLNKAVRTRIALSQLSFIYNAIIEIGSASERS
jgi:hypothetical protein